MSYEGEQRPSSDNLVDLHVSIVPIEHWVERLNYASCKIISDTFSAGFLRVSPDTHVAKLRNEIQDQLGHANFPTEYVFLKHVGRCLALVRQNQEGKLKVKNFLPPHSIMPEIFVLPGHPSMYTYSVLPPINAMHQNSLDSQPNTETPLPLPAPLLDTKIALKGKRKSQQNLVNLRDNETSPTPRAFKPQTKKSPRQQRNSSLEQPKRHLSGKSSDPVPQKDKANMQRRRSSVFASPTNDQPEDNFTPSPTRKNVPAGKPHPTKARSVLIDGPKQHQVSYNLPQESNSVASSLGNKNEDTSPSPYQGEDKRYMYSTNDDSGYVDAERSASEASTHYIHSNTRDSVPLRKNEVAPVPRRSNNEEIENSPTAKRRSKVWQAFSPKPSNSSLYSKPGSPLLWEHEQSNADQQSQVTTEMHTNEYEHEHEDFQNRQKQQQILQFPSQPPKNRNFHQQETNEMHTNEYEHEEHQYRKQQQQQQILQFPPQPPKNRNFQPQHSSSSNTPFGPMSDDLSETGSTHSSTGMTSSAQLEYDSAEESNHFERRGSIYRKNYHKSNRKKHSNKYDAEFDSDSEDPNVKPTTQRNSESKNITQSLTINTDEFHQQSKRIKRSSYSNTGSESGDIALTLQTTPLPEPSVFSESLHNTSLTHDDHERNHKLQSPTHGTEQSTTIFVEGDFFISHKKENSFVENEVFVHNSNPTHGEDIASKSPPPNEQTSESPTKSVTLAFTPVHENAGKGIANLSGQPLTTNWNTGEEILTSSNLHRGDPDGMPTVTTVSSSNDDDRPAFLIPDAQDPVQDDTTKDDPFKSLPETVFNLPQQQSTDVQPTKGVYETAGPGAGDNTLIPDTPQKQAPPNEAAETHTPSPITIPVFKKPPIESRDLLDSSQSSVRNVAVNNNKSNKTEKESKAKRETGVVKNTKQNDKRSDSASREKLWSELQRARTDRRNAENKRQELVRQAKMTTSKMNQKRTSVSADFKKMFPRLKSAKQKSDLPKEKCDVPGCYYVFQTSADKKRHFGLVHRSRVVTGVSYESISAKSWKRSVILQSSNEKLQSATSVKRKKSAFGSTLKNPEALLGRKVRFSDHRNSSTLDPSSGIMLTGTPCQASNWQFNMESYRVRNSLTVSLNQSYLRKQRHE
ncbi:uncharacterized protein LOC100183485 isoform X2 [Ciona intestinalis]